MVLLALSASLTVSFPVAAEVLPPGARIEKGVTANVTPDGIDFLLDQGLELMPDQIVIPDLTGSQSCFFSTVNYHVYQGQLTNGLSVNIGSATVLPRQGYFDLSFTATIAGTGSDDPPGGTNLQSFVATRVEYGGCGTSCDNGDYAVLRLTPTPIAVSTRLDMVLAIDPVTGDPTVEITTPLQRSDIVFNTNNIDAAGCAAIDVLTAVLKGFVGDFVKDKIIQEVNETLIPAIEEGFQSVRYDDDIDIAGKTVHVKIVPSALSVRTDGVSISMASAIGAVDPGTICVPVAADAGSLFTPGDPPMFGTFSPGGFNYDAGAAVSDDLVNQALFAAWHGGLLCQTLTSLGSAPLTTELLALAGLSGPLNALGVPSGTPMLVVIKGYEPPSATFGGAHHVNLSVKRLEVSVFTEVYDRITRIVALDLDAAVGADLLIDSNNMLTPLLDLAPENVSGVITYDEPMGAAAGGILALLPVLIDQLEPQLAGALPSIDLGNLAGVQLVNTEFVAMQGTGGVSKDNLGIFTGLAPAPGGCAAASGGCGVGGGTAGCDLDARTGPRANAGRPSGNAGVFLLLAFAPFGFVALRRRRRE